MMTMNDISQAKGLKNAQCGRYVNTGAFSFTEQLSGLRLSTWEYIVRCVNSIVVLHDIRASKSWGLIPIRLQALYLVTAE